VPATLPPLRSDAEKLRIVLANLVGNALKFTERGEAVVAVASAGEDLSITVRDTGIGIPSDEQQLIFEAFRQGGATARQPRGGAGLGLHIVKRLVELLGGTIAVESAVGRGSAFTVRLPAGA
jgi:signal transduction histidine kinase